MNNVSLIGRLTRDPELRYLQGSNQAVARFTLAVDKQLGKDKKQELEGKGQPTADFIRIVIWGAMAENLCKFAGKGDRIGIQGRISTGSYENNGQKVYTTDVVATNVTFIDWKNNNNNQGFGNSADSEFEFNDWDSVGTDDRIPF